MAAQMSKKKKFVADGVFFAELNELDPMFLVRRVEGLESLLHWCRRDSNSQRIALNYLFCANVFAKVWLISYNSLKYMSHEGSRIFMCLKRVMACGGVMRLARENGAKGIIISGKPRAQRAKSMKFKDGYMISSGQPVRDYVDSAVRHVLLRQGVLGIKVKIMLEWDPKGKMGPVTPLPDFVTILSPKEEKEYIRPAALPLPEVASVKSKSNFPRVSFSLSLGFAVSNSLSCLCNSPFLNDAGEFNGECNLCDSRRRCQRQAFGPNLDVKLAGATQDRYRLLISDSVLVQQAMLATQLNGLVKAGGLRKGSVVQLIEYICTHIQNRKIIVVLNMEIIIPDCDIIGNPKMFDESDSAVQKSVPERPLLSAASDNNNSHLGAQNAVHSNAPFRNNVNSSNLASSAQSFRPVVQPPYQPPPNFKGHGAIMKNEAPACIIPIAALNPYQGRWAIKARVTAKGNLHRYNNAKGDACRTQSEALKKTVLIPAAVGETSESGPIVLDPTTSSENFGSILASLVVTGN
ncbi:OLC1v1014087C1 [Oldenlandia corymbosa var. corymbosa]|uniref:OLC1v1014087C1 n=1 Tax=Oldenlandia corymbosa var. corymbosa TaxID=529605 RepID=A0AAV1E1Z0_OLDCO|nr:OLC1v1014087C1 [Oldenlandia corymbosa var. corymbosa]